MPVRTDVDLLRQRIQLPEGVQQATWIVLPVGGTGGAVPGPTDTQLFAFINLTPAGWEAISTSPQPTDHQTVSVPEAAVAILPKDVLSNAQRSGTEYKLGGQTYSAAKFDLGGYRGLYAIRVGDGLLVSLQTQ